jgi:DNA-directed RNA polymerase specialized sigma24 family protein
METTIDLLARVRQGDSAAVSALMERSVLPLRRWARGRMPQFARNFADTQDIVQEAFVRVLPTLATVEAIHPGALQALLRQAVADHIDDMRQDPESAPGISVPEAFRTADSAPSPVERVVGREGLKRYEAAFRQLSPPDREAIVARIELQQSYEEVAIALGMPDAAAARAAVTGALARLIEAMA